MGSNARASGFLKECMADALIQLMPQKEFSRITVNEIATAAGVNRSTWFRHFETKNDALTFKLVQLWLRYTAVQPQISQHYTLENAHDFLNLPIRSANCSQLFIRPVHNLRSTVPFIRL